MEALEKIDLVDKISRELQSRMTYNQIETYLIAVGINLILPIQNGFIPYGFIGKYQAVNSKNKSVAEVAFSIFNSISKSSKSKEKMLTSLVNLIFNTKDIDIAIKQLEIFSSLKSISIDLLTDMSEKINNNIILMESDIFLDKLNILLKDYDVKMPNNSFRDKDEISF